MKLVNFIHNFMLELKVFIKLAFIGVGNQHMVHIFEWFISIWSIIKMTTWFNLTVSEYEARRILIVWRWPINWKNNKHICFGWWKHAKTFRCYRNWWKCAVYIFIHFVISPEYLLHYTIHSSWVSIFIQGVSLEQSCSEFRWVTGYF